jgi:hypothetical protein
MKYIAIITILHYMKEGEAIADVSGYAVNDD